MLLSSTNLRRTVFTTTTVTPVKSLCCNQSLHRSRKLAQSALSRKSGLACPGIQMISPRSICLNFKLCLMTRGIQQQRQHQEEGDPSSLKDSDTLTKSGHAHNMDWSRLQALRKIKVSPPRSKHKERTKEISRTLRRI